jgi:uncharacterized protein YegL
LRITAVLVAEVPFTCTNVNGAFEALTSDRGYTMAEQIPFGTNSFAENPEPRCPCVLLLDVSGSMAGAPISALNVALTAYREDVLADRLAAKRVEVALVTFGGQVQTVCDFTTMEGFHPPTLAAAGETPLGEAVRQGIDMLARRKQEYKAHGISYYRPWLFLFTDGAPTDEWQSAADQARQGEAAKAFTFFAVGVEGANLEVLKQFSARPPLPLKGLQFREFFLWLSRSQSSVSRSKPGEGIQLPKPTWTSIEI